MAAQEIGYWAAGFGIVRGPLQQSGIERRAEAMAVASLGS